MAKRIHELLMRTLHGDVHRERHIRRKPSSTKEKAPGPRLILRLSGSRSRCSPRPLFGGLVGRGIVSLSFQAFTAPHITGLRALAKVAYCAVRQWALERATEKTRPP